MRGKIQPSEDVGTESVRVRSFPELVQLVSEEIKDGFWRHVPRVIYECWQLAGGKRTSEETTEQRQIGRWRNSYVFLEDLGNVKSISHVLNGRVLFTKTLAQALLLDMLAHWTFDSKATEASFRRPIRDCSDLEGAANQLVKLIFSNATADEREGFEVAKLRIKEERYEEFANHLGSFSNVYILSRYRSIRGVSREQALTSLYELKKAKPERPGSATALAEFAELGGALSSSLGKTSACWTWICDFGIPAQGRAAGEEIDWLAYLNISDLISAFHAFLVVHSHAVPELIQEAHMRCRFVVKNSPTLVSKRAALFKDIEFMESLASDTATLAANPLPEQMPPEWKSLLIGSRGQVLQRFPQTVLAGYQDEFEFYYFPRDLDSDASVDTLLIDASYQPESLRSSLRLISSALGIPSSIDSIAAQKKLVFLNWDILTLRELMELQNV